MNGGLLPNAIGDSVAIRAVKYIFILYLFNRCSLIFFERLSIVVCPVEMCAYINFILHHADGMTATAVEQRFLLFISLIYMDRLEYNGLCREIMLLLQS